jgi:peptide/nickel transport system substrate-binding protein
MLHEQPSSSQLAALRDAVDGELTRRRLLSAGAKGAFALGAGSLLAACGASGSSSHTTSLGGAKPVRGGTLTIGMITGGTAETLVPGSALVYDDIMRANQIYDYLFFAGDDIKSLVPTLATSAEPNADATKWTFHLRDGVHWHDGKPFTADDVVWTIKSWASPANFMSGGAGLFVDYKGVRKRDPLTVEVPMFRPCAQFPSFTSFVNAAIIQNGATTKSLSAHPIGTGPFKFVSFTPGTESVFERNPNYWRDPDKPYVDKLVINSSFTDETSRNNALLSGQTDVSPIYPFPFAKQQQSGGQVNLLRSPGTAAYYFTMRVDKGPFTDNRVRQALKLIIDRNAMVSNIFAGYGTVGNDTYSKYQQYAVDVPPMHDIEKAKSLLKAAGREGMSVTLQTAPGVPGQVESATLLSEQAKAAGMNINVQQVAVATYFTSAGGFLTRSFGNDSGETVQSATIWAAFQLLKGASEPETGWPNQPGGGNQPLLNSAVAELNTTKAASLWDQAWHQQISEGGHIIWGWPDWIDACATHVRGLTAGKGGPMNNFRILDGWLAS